MSADTDRIAGWLVHTVERLGLDDGDLAMMMMRQGHVLIGGWLALIDGATLVVIDGHDATERSEVPIDVDAMASHARSLALTDIQLEVMRAVGADM